MPKITHYQELKVFHGYKMKRQSKNFQSCPSFQITQPVLALTGEKKKKIPVVFLETQKYGSRLGTPTTGIPWIVGLMRSVHQESRNSMWINAEGIISSSRGYDKIVNGLKKIKLYSLAHPRNSSMQRIYQKKTDADIARALGIGFDTECRSFSQRPVTAEKEKHSQTKTWSNVKLTQTANSWLNKLMNIGLCPQITWDRKEMRKAHQHKSFLMHLVEYF